MGKPKSSYVLWILGHFLRLLFTLLIIAVCAGILWRVACSGNVPSALEDITGNEVLRTALATHGDLTILEQEQVKYTEGPNNYAYFSADWCYFIKEADQVQLVLYYNNSTLERLAERKGLAEVPPAGEVVFDVKLTQYVDVTPADYVKVNENDILTEKIEVSPSAVQVETTSLYTFFRYTFDGVDLSKDTVVIYLDMCHGEQGESFGTLRLFHREDESEERTLSSTEREIIAN